MSPRTSSLGPVAPGDEVSLRVDARLDLFILTLNGADTDVRAGDLDELEEAWTAAEEHMKMAELACVACDGTGADLWDHHGEAVCQACHGSAVARP